MRRRRKIEIFAEILNLAKNGSRTNMLVFETKSNFKQMRRYIQILIEEGFVEFVNGYFFTTALGFEFLEKCEELMAVFSSIEDGNRLRAFVEM
jgi:predicted transcriptional regulator